MGRYLQVFTTTPDRDTANRLAGELVDAGLAACVQIVGPIGSTYRWQGRTERADEWLCLLKTSEDVYPELERAIAHSHPYDTPEIVAVPISAGSNRYLAWLGDCLSR